MKYISLFLIWMMFGVSCKGFCQPDKQEEHVTDMYDRDEAEIDESNSNPPVISSDWIADTTLYGFSTHYYEATADYSERVRFKCSIDIPKRSVRQSDGIKRWIVEKILASESIYSHLLLNNSHNSERYDGDIYDYKSVCKYASNVFFATVKNDYAMNEMDYPSLFFTLCLRAFVKDRRFVTFQQCTYEYYGGAHAYSTERYISYDFIHKKEINNKYLFKEDRLKDILSLIKEEAKKLPDYQIWEPNIDQYSCIRDGNISVFHMKE